MDEHAANRRKLPEDVLELCFVFGVIALETLEEHLEEYGLDLESLTADQISDLVNSYDDQDVEGPFRVAHTRALRRFASKQRRRKPESVEEALNRKLNSHRADGSP